MSNCDVVYTPIKFLGATVLSFNTSLGLGSAAESSLNVDLIEDCEASPPDLFLPINNLVEVGAPVYFLSSPNGTGFNFGGVLSSWTISKGQSGTTYNVKVVDPRQLLENTIVITDSYIYPPFNIPDANYVNVYAAYESSVLQGNCAAFGSSMNSSQGGGMPYTLIIQALQTINPIIKSPTGYTYNVDWASFPTNIPEFYRVPGPAITILQLLQDVCNVLGREFYTNLVLTNGQHLITVGTVDVSSPPPAFGEIIGSFQGTATELSYGQELRNEKTKMLLFGEQQHYLDTVTAFMPYFGEETVGVETIPVVPYRFDPKCFGFWIKKKIKELNLSLNFPLSSDGPYDISEMDIKAAMASFEAWRHRVEGTPAGEDPDAGEYAGTLNQAVKVHYEININGTIKKLIDATKNDADKQQGNLFRGLPDAFNSPTRTGTLFEELENDFSAIHAFVKNLGDTYYGKQFLTYLDNGCGKYGTTFQEKIFTAVPTSAGAWVDPGTSVLGLSDPDLNTFRETDDRISAFALFSLDNIVPGPSGNAPDICKPKESWWWCPNGCVKETDQNWCGSPNALYNSPFNSQQECEEYKNSHSE
jgi:hypothetical protein